MPWPPTQPRAHVHAHPLRAYHPRSWYGVSRRHFSPIPAVFSARVSPPALRADEPTSRRADEPTALTRALAHSRICALAPTHPHTRSLARSLARPLAHSHARALARARTRALAHSPARPFAHPLTRPLARSLAHCWLYLGWGLLPKSCTSAQPKAMAREFRRSAPRGASTPPNSNDWLS